MADVPAGPAPAQPLWYCAPCLATAHAPMPGTCPVCGGQMVLAAGYGVRTAGPSPRSPLIHELEFTDRTARPATWQARCGAPSVPLERTTSVPENVTCPDCAAAPGSPAPAEAIETDAMHCVQPVPAEAIAAAVKANNEFYDNEDDLKYNWRDGSDVRELARQMLTAAAPVLRGEGAAAERERAYQDVRQALAADGYLELPPKLADLLAAAPEEQR